MDNCIITDHESGPGFARSRRAGVETASAAGQGGSRGARGVERDRRRRVRHGSRINHYPWGVSRTLL